MKMDIKIKLQIFLLFIASCFSQAMMSSMSWKCLKEEYLSCPSNVIASAGEDVRLTCRLKNPNSLNWVFNSTKYISMGGHLDSSYNNKYSISNDGDLEIKAIMLDGVGRYDCHSTESGAHFYSDVHALFSGPHCQLFRKELDATVNCSIDYAGNANVSILLEDSRGRVLYSDWKDSKLSIANVSIEAKLEADVPWYRISLYFHRKQDEEGASNVPEISKTFSSTERPPKRTTLAETSRPLPKRTTLAEFSKTFDTTEKPPKRMTLAESSKTFDTTERPPKRTTLAESSKPFHPTASSGPHESRQNNFVWLLLGSSGVVYSAIVITAAVVIFFIYKKRRYFCRNLARELLRNVQKDREIQTEEPSRDTTDESFRDTTHALTSERLEMKITKPIDPDECRVSMSTDISPLGPPQQSYQVQDEDEESEYADEGDGDDDNDDDKENESEPMFNK